MTPFTMQEDELLINLISQKPQLYDVKLEKDSSVRDIIWEEIARQLNKSSSDCRKRWKHIRDSYNRCVRKSKLHNTKIKWTLFKKLGFLSNCPLETHTIKVPINEENEEQWTDSYYGDDISVHGAAETMSAEETDSFVNETITPTIINDSIKLELDSEMIPPETSEVAETNSPEENDRVRKRKTRMKKRIIKRKPENSKVSRTLEKYWEDREKDLQAQIKSLKDDQEAQGIRAFCDHVEAILTKLPPHLRVEAKSKVFNILFQYEMASVSSTYQNETLDPLRD